MCIYSQCLQWHMNCTSSCIFFFYLFSPALLLPIQRRSSITRAISSIMLHIKRALETQHKFCYIINSNFLFSELWREKSSPSSFPLNSPLDDVIAHWSGSHRFTLHLSSWIRYLIVASLVWNPTTEINLGSNDNYDISELPASVR